MLRRALPLAAIIVLASCALPGLPAQAPAPTETPAPTVAPPSPTPIALDFELSVEAAGFRLRHPAGWASHVVSNTLTLAPSDASLDRPSPGPDLVLTVDATPADLVAAQYGAEAASNPESFFEVSSSAAQQAGYALSATTAITVDGRPGLAADLRGDGGAGRLAVIVGPDRVVRVLGQSSPDSWDAQSALFDSILASLSFFVPAQSPTPTPVGVALQPDLLRRGPPGFVLRIGGSGGPRDSRFVSARGMAVAPDGTLYLAESSRGVWVFAPDGALITTFGADQLLDAYDVVRAPSGDLLVADYGRNAVARFSPAGAFVRRWGSAGDGPDQFGLSSPQRIALGPDGSVYALDSRPGADGQVSSSVMIFGPDGDLLDRVALPADLAPADLAVDSAGNIYLAETFGGSVVKLAPSGAELARFGDPATAQSLAAGSIDLDPQGNIYLATYASGVVKLSPEGVEVAQGGGSAAAGSAPEAGQFSLPNGVAAGPGGVVWVSDNSGEYSAVTALRLSDDPSAQATSAALGATTVADATPAPAESLLRQWAESATASSFYEPDYDPAGAAGPPDVPGCQDSPDAWASSTPDGLDTLELTYATPVFATGLTIYQSSQPGYISKVELIDERGEVLPVYAAEPALSDTCPLAQAISFAQTLSRVVKVRVTVDQRGGAGWSEIDAVELVGVP
ncbi:NHL repeat-containing protein [Oscillochloris sp. ZM17-4]|nr:NHL repeat-containing protein [Oscillochloris sp. ZM17-4]